MGVFFFTWTFYYCIINNISIPIDNSLNVNHFFVISDFLIDVFSLFFLLLIFSFYIWVKINKLINSNILFASLLLFASDLNLKNYI